MAFLRIILHSFVLVVANIASIIAGFILYRALAPARQILIQIPAATVLSILLFIVWTLGVRALRRQLLLTTSRELIFAFFCSLAWNPVVWVPLHYVTQGYLTSIGNILGLLLFQLPVNLIAIVVASIIVNPQRLAGERPV